MAGLVPAIHVLPCCKGVDARDKPAHDDGRIDAYVANLKCITSPSATT
jgi:hypothetical protein